MSEGKGRRWYVVLTQPHAEFKAADHLQRQGFEPYLPRYLKRRRHARRTEIVPAPLFPRYLFVGADLTTQRWRAIHSTIGVARLVCHGETPARVAETIIDELKASQDEKGYARLPVRPPLRSGDAIRVVEGAFASCLGLFEGMTDGERVAILLDLLGRKVRVSIGIDAIVLAGSTA
jgi:transcriptional antiterminator RfaH